MEVRVEKIRFHDVNEATVKMQELYDADWRLAGDPLIKDNLVLVFLERGVERPIKKALNKKRKEDDVEIQPPEEE